MRLTLLSRASDLAVLQARLVASALQSRWPALELALETRGTTGDRNASVPLTQVSDKGLFTSDLSEAVAAGRAQIAVHSWKDLPIDERPDTVVAGTLARADPRDVLLIRRDRVLARPEVLTVLTSSPRRGWQLVRSLPRLLPWPVVTVSPVAVRGNIPTRVRKLIQGEGDALVVAKAALDRLLSEEAPAEVSSAIRQQLAACAWMVLPIRDFPAAPAQGALAIEVARDRADVIALVAAVSDEPTIAAVTEERAFLRERGGGCHEAIGVTVLSRAYGRVRSVRGQLPDGGEMEEWSLTHAGPEIEVADPDRIFPKPDERRASTRRPLEVAWPRSASAFWVSRVDALPLGVVPSADQVVWAAGGHTWRQLAARGVWVNGSAEGLGDEETAGIEGLAGRSVEWLRLTHTDADAPNSLATYVAEPYLPLDLATRTHFYWTSGSAFRRALAEYPSIRERWHASGPGRTARALLATLGPSPRVSIFLDYEHWLRSVTR